MEVQLVAIPEAQPWLQRTEALHTRRRRPFQLILQELSNSPTASHPNQPAQRFLEWQPSLDWFVVKGAESKDYSRATGLVCSIYRSTKFSLKAPLEMLGQHR